MKAMKTFLYLLFFTVTCFATPLHTALNHINEPEVKRLVEEGASINALDENGRTPLHLAARIGRLSIVEYLVEHGADTHVKDNFHKTPLVYAIEKNRVKVIIYLSKEVNKPQQNKSTNVFDLAQEGKTDEVRNFFQDVDINSINEDGKTILHIGCEYRQIDIVKLGIELGIDKNIRDYDGRNALNYAKLSGNKTIIKLLQDYNATE